VLAVCNNGGTSINDEQHAEAISACVRGTSGPTFHFGMHAGPTMMVPSPWEPKVESDFTTSSSELYEDLQGCGNQCKRAQIGGRVKRRNPANKALSVGTVGGQCSHDLLSRSGENLAELSMRLDLRGPVSTSCSG
jgi:hypothetical protein